MVALCASTAGCVAAFALLVYVLLAAPSVEAVVVVAGFCVLTVCAVGIAWRARVEACRERDVDVLIERILRT